MAVNLFDRPIPGQSLVSEPKNRPYERPPEITDPEEALMVHLARLNEVDVIDGAMYLIQKGVDVRSITEGILRSAVAQGIHSIDVSLIIAPAIHEYISGTADVVGLEYEDGFEDKKAREEAMYQMNQSLGETMLRKAGVEDMGREEAASVTEDLTAREDVPVEGDQIEMDLGEEPAPKGLMARM